MLAVKKTVLRQMGMRMFHPSFRCAGVLQRAGFVLPVIAAGMIAVCGGALPVMAQGLPLQKGGVEKKPETGVSPELRQLLPLIVQQLQNNPALLKQYGLGAAGAAGGGLGNPGALGGFGGLGGLGGLSGLDALGGDGGADGGGDAGIARPALPPIPGLDAAIAKALTQNGGAAVAPHAGAKPAPNGAAGALPGAPQDAAAEQIGIYRQQYHPIDMDHDGRISADEAAAYASWMFRRRDINGDGVLVMREFSAVEALPGNAAANRSRLRVESHRLELLFGEFDSDGNKTISKEEFLRHAKSQFDEKRGQTADLDPFAFQTVLPF